MAEITVEMIKKLRDKTGIGMGACKKALVEAKGDMEQAITNLRKAGMASAVKKSDREANEGQIAAAETDSHVAVVEVNAETDFVVKNERFQEFLRDIAEEVAATKPASLEDFLKQPFSKDQNITIDEYRATIVQTIGENIKISRIEVFPKTQDKSIGIYSHLGGKIVVIVELSGTSGEESLAKDIAMHVAAASPDYLSPKDVPAEILDKEKEIVRSQVSGKPDNVVEKIIEGKINAFYKDNCLTDQPYIRNDKQTVAQLIAERGKEANKSLEIARFSRWTVGQ